MKKYFKLLRIEQWIKNLLVLAPVIFGKKIFDVDYVYLAVVGTLLFSLMASAIYIINDINDVESDKKHPTKCMRPIASGKVSMKCATVIAAGLIFIGGIGSAVVCLNSVVYLVIYLLINILYSIFKWKHIPLVDILILAAGFLLRVFYGAVITRISVSNWLYLTVLVFSLFFALGKRKKELMSHGDNTRQVLKYYSVDFLDKNMYMCLTLGIVFYSLWSITAAEKMVYTVPLVLFISFYYNLILSEDSDGDPTSILLQHRLLLLVCLFYIIIVISILYFL